MISLAYATRDHIIPWRMFAILAADLGHLWALEQAQFRESLRQGISLALSPGDATVRRTQMDLVEEAFPIEGTPPTPQIFFEKKG